MANTGNQASDETPASDGRSNLSRYYEQQFDAVVALFEDRTAGEFDFVDSCRRLLADPQLPLPWRISCGYMLAHASDEPAKEIEEALNVVRIVERTNEADGVQPQTWLVNMKTELERILPGLQEIAARSENMTPEELEAAVAAIEAEEALAAAATAATGEEATGATGEDDGEGIRAPNTSQTPEPIHADAVTDQTTDTPSAAPLEGQEKPSDDNETSPAP